MSLRPSDESPDRAGNRIRAVRYADLPAFTRDGYCTPVPPHESAPPKRIEAYATSEELREVRLPERERLATRREVVRGRGCGWTERTAPLTP